MITVCVLLLWFYSDSLGVDKVPTSMRGKWRQKKLTVSEPITPKIRLYLQIMKLAEIVFQTHYSFLQEHKQDLISVAIDKAVRMIEKGDFDPSRGNLRNYLYSGMRNEQQNYYVKYLRFSRKEIVTDDLSLVQSIRPLYDSVYTIDFSSVYSPILKFHRRYGDLRHFALDYILDIGWFILDDVPDLSDVPVTNVPKNLQNKLRTILMWSVFDNIIE